MGIRGWDPAWVGCRLVRAGDTWYLVGAGVPGVRRRRRRRRRHRRSSVCANKFSALMPSIIAFMSFDMRLCFLLLGSLCACIKSFWLRTCGRTFRWGMLAANSSMLCLKATWQGASPPMCCVGWWWWWKSYGPWESEWAHGISVGP